MNQTSNGMNGNSRQSPPLPLMAKSLRGSRSRKEKTGPPSDPVTALPSLAGNEPPAPPPRAPKRGEGSRSKASERPAIPAEVADLISFAQAYPAQVEGSDPVKDETPKAVVKAAPAAPAAADGGRPPYAVPKVVFEAGQPSGVLHHNFREAYSDSFREALESYRENVRPEELDATVAAIAPAPRKPWRSRFYTGPEEVLPEQVLQVLQPAEPKQPEEPAVAVESGPSLRVRLGESVRVVGRRVLERVSAIAAVPARGLRSAWNWYQGRRVLQTSTRRMRVEETISLGEKRFLAVVQVDDCQFLVGGGASSVAVLAQLGTLQTARDLMNQKAGEAQA